MSKKEVIGKIVKVVLRSLANSYAFVNANGRAYYFSIPDINKAKKFHVGTEVVFTPVVKGVRPFANDVHILMTESYLMQQSHLLQQNDETLHRITDTPFLDKHVREFTESWFKRESSAEVES